MSGSAAVPTAYGFMVAVLLSSQLAGVARAQAIDPGADRLPRFYAPGSSDELAGASERGLNYILGSVRRDEGWVLLTGHLDAAEAGEAGRLDRERAEFVRGWLVARGLRPERVWTRGRGADEPIVASSGAEPQNRRVDFLMTHHGTACRQELRGGVHDWFRRNCFLMLRAADSADCDRASRLLR